MSLLRLTCRACGRTFESGVPLTREHLVGVKMRCLEVCPECGTASEYTNADYRDPEALDPPFGAPAGGDPASAE